MKNTNNPSFKRLDKDKHFEAYFRAIKHFKRLSSGIIVKLAKRLEIAPRLLKREIEKLDCFL